MTNERLQNVKGSEVTRIEEERLWRGSSEDLEVRVNERNFVDKESGEKIFVQETLSIQSPYTLQPVPYAGPISAKTSCSADLLPRAVAAGASVKGYMIPSNERMALGICDKTKVKGTMLRIAVLCEAAKTSYLIKIFAPGEQKERLMKVLEGFRCT